LDKIFYWELDLRTANSEQVLEFIVTRPRKQSEKYYIVTPNPELLVIASKDSKYLMVLDGAKLALPDGIGVVLAGKLLGRPLRERIPWC